MLVEVSVSLLCVGIDRLPSLAPPTLVPLPESSTSWIRPFMWPRSPGLYSAVLRLPTNDTSRLNRLLNDSVSNKRDQMIFTSISILDV